MRILLVEPDASAARDLAEVLRAGGVTIDTVAEGEAAFAHAELLTYQAVVTELALPDMTGLSLLRSLRAVRNATPVLFLSACGDVEMRVKALSNGADDYLTKPAHADELLARLHAAVRRAAGRCAGRRGGRLRCSMSATCRSICWKRQSKSPASACV